MDPERAWQSALGQLQMQMPRASFDTWVRDTHVLSFEDGVLTVGAANAYARDWLESRLTSTMSRLLIGVLNERVTVHFAVAESGENQTIDVDNSEPKDEPANPEKVIQVSPEDFDSAYEQIVRPDRAVYLPGYFRRWLKVLGPDLGWMYVSFRQAAYLAGGRKGNSSNRFTGKNLASMAGITERTYWNRLNNPSTWERLKGLVQISDHGPEWDDSSSTPKRLPRRYTVAMTLPLTPVDANSLQSWLTSNLETFGGPEGVLRAAAEAPVEQLIPPDVVDAGEPATVIRLVRELFGEGELSDKLLASLASAIQTHLMPQNDLIVVTLFFLEHVLPHLGAGPGWMLTLLREMCYTDPETGAARNRVTVKGGYAEIAGWMGLSRAMTVWEWFNGRVRSSKRSGESGKFRNPVTQVYLHEVTEGKASRFGSSPRAFEVLLEEVPQEILEAALTGRDLHAIFSIADADHHADFSIGLTRFSEDHHALFSHAFTRFSYDLHATCTVKSSLTLKTNSLKLLKPNPAREVESTTTRDTENAEKPAAVDFSALPSAWDLDWFFRKNKTSSKMQRTLRQVGATGQALVSWLLFAASTDPGSKRIDSPYAFALSRLVESPTEGQSADFDRLAALPPRILVDMLRGADFDNLDARLFEKLMVNPARDGWGGQPRYRALLPILLGEKAVLDKSPSVERVRISRRYLGSRASP